MFYFLNKHIELLKENLNNFDKSVSNELYQKELDKINELEVSFQSETELWQYQLNQDKLLLLQKIEIKTHFTIFLALLNSPTMIFDMSPFICHGRVATL